DSLGNPILDTWLTTGSGGFDLDAVGAINVVPEPLTGALLGGGVALLVCYGRLRRRGEVRHQEDSLAIRFAADHSGEMDPQRKATELQNAQAWDALARQRAALARPARDEDFANPLATVDPLGWLGESITGRKVLCLAA